MTPERMKALREGGMTYAEIASHAGCNPGTVWQKLNREAYINSAANYQTERRIRGNCSVWEWWNEQRGNPKTTR